MTELLDVGQARAVIALLAGASIYFRRRTTRTPTMPRKTSAAARVLAITALVIASVALAVVLACIGGCAKPELPPATRDVQASLQGLAAPLADSDHRAEDIIELAKQERAEKLANKDRR